MGDSTSGESLKVRRDRIRPSVLTCLKPIQEQEDSALGCVLVLVAYPVSAYGLHLVADTSWLGSLGFGVLVWLFPLMAFGYYVDLAEKRSRTRGYQMFERTFAPGSDRRELALSVLRDIAQSTHTHSVSADHLLTELGENKLTEPPPETQLTDQLEELVEPPRADRAPETTPPPPPRKDHDSSPPSRRDYIPLEPEDPDKP